MKATEEGVFQAYFVVHECDSKYTNKNVTVEKVPSKDDSQFHRCLKITAIADPEVDFAYLPQYYGAFAERFHQPVLAHIYDVLAEMVFTTYYNMEGEKNITIDIYSSELNYEKLCELRDRLGFVVTNNYTIYEVNAYRTILQSNLANKISAIDEQQKEEEEGEEEEEDGKEGEKKKPTTTTTAANKNVITYENLTEFNEELLFDYDSTTSLFNRDKYLNFLLKTKEVKCIIALEVGQPVGYVMALNDRILQCYAETETIARNLVCKVLAEMQSETVKMFISGTETAFSEDIIAAAEQLYKLQRYHTRTVPTQIKWENVFLLNAGVYLY